MGLFTRALAVGGLVAGLASTTLAQTSPPTPPSAIAAAPADEAPPPSPAAVAEDLNAAVRPPPANSDADAPADIRAHEERAAEALDPNNPSALADYAPSGPGCGQNGSMLACGTNLEVRDRPTERSPTPDRDLMGQPR